MPRVRFSLEKRRETKLQDQTCKQQISEGRKTGCPFISFQFLML